MIIGCSNLGTPRCSNAYVINIRLLLLLLVLYNENINIVQNHIRLDNTRRQDGPKYQDIDIVTPVRYWTPTCKQKLILIN